MKGKKLRKKRRTALKLVAASVTGVGYTGSVSGSEGDGAVVDVSEDGIVVYRTTTTKNPLSQNDFERMRSTLQRQYTKRFGGTAPQFSDPDLAGNHLLGCGLYASAEGRAAQSFGQTSVDQEVDHARAARKVDSEVSDFVARAKRGVYDA